MKKSVLWALTVSVLAFSSCDKDDEDPDGNNVSAKDREFALKASMNNFAEIEAGKLAAQKATNPGVKEFGEHMVTEHTATGNELKSIASGLSVYVADSLDAEHQALKQTLMSASGQTFDSIYMASQVKDHEATIALFEDEVAMGEHVWFRSFADSVLPHLNSHLTMADSLADSLP